ncbi:hypothetical protein I4U23_008499 [Adineta vaga]|nr:hypothetical protein I4U23_008499 [Adineta vaga]
MLITSVATSTKPDSISLLLPLVTDDETSMITRTTAASTNLTATEDTDTNDDDQSKLINEQIKRSSLGLARDSLELLRNNTPHHRNSEEQLTPRSNVDSTPRKRKSVLKSRIISSNDLPTPKLISYIAIDELKDDKRSIEQQIHPKPKRDSLTLLQQYSSGLTTPHSGRYHLSNSDDKHVEFIREPGNTITPVLHVGRGIKSKYFTNKHINSTFSNEFYHHILDPILDLSERSKSDISLIDKDNSTKYFSPRQHTPQIPLSSMTIPYIETDDTMNEKVCLNKNEYDKMIRLIITSLLKKKKKNSSQSTMQLNNNLCNNNRLTIFQNIILLILLISFYVFIFIKSQYWQEYNKK